MEVNGEGLKEDVGAGRMYCTLVGLVSLAFGGHRSRGLR